MAQTTINNGDTGANVRTALNSMFSELYATITSPLKLTGVSANAQISVPANTYIQDIVFASTSGSPVLRLGTTPNGQDLLTDTQPGKSLVAAAQQYFSEKTTLYLTLTGSGIVNVRFNCQYNFY